VNYLFLLPDSPQLPIDCSFLLFVLTFNSLCLCSKSLKTAREVLNILLHGKFFILVFLDNYISLFLHFT
jgi:hypothetical protein